MKEIVSLVALTLISNLSFSQTKPLARAADRPEDYKKLNIEPKNIALWEDGMRTDGKKGSYEWWYFDTHLTDGTAVVIVFYTKPFVDTNSPLSPFISVEITRPGEVTTSKILPFKSIDFKSSKEKCDVNIGNNYFRGDLQNYQIHVADSSFTIDVKLKSHVPAWRPKSGYMYFGEQDKYHFSWLPSVPEGQVELDLKTSDKTEHLTGIGYHDHNWGNKSMLKLINNWYWGRAKAGEYSIISSYITAEQKYGNTKFSIFMLAKNGKIIVDDANKVKFTLVDEHIDEKTGKPFANTVIYEYIDNNERYKITYQREKNIRDVNFIDFTKGYKKFLAKLVGFNGSYIRFTGNVRLEHFVNEKIVEDVNDKGIWELMYFGKVR